MAGVIAFSAFIAAFDAAQAGKTYKYDELGRLIKVTDDAAAKQTVFNYDAAGNRVQTAQEATTVPKPSFSVNDVTAAEAAALLFTVTKTGATNEAFSVNYATANGTASAGSDYTSASGTLTFFFNETQKTVSVPTLADAVSEGNETALLNLSAATDGATIADSQGAGTITNVTPPSFTINSASGSEGDFITFTVTRSGSTSGTNSVNYATRDGTAIGGIGNPGHDYQQIGNGSLSFAPGVITRTVSVEIFEDFETEPAQNFYVDLSNAILGSPATGTGTILAN
jgi:YD repeat-containing protein